MRPRGGSRAPLAGLQNDPRVTRRRVIYAHGFDPASSERYRRLIARAGGTGASIGPVAALSPVSEGWRIVAPAEPDAVSVETLFEVIRYEDIVRGWRGRSRFMGLASGFASLARFAISGGLGRSFGFAKEPAFLIFYPLLMLGGLLAGGLALGVIVGAGAGATGWARAPVALAGLGAGALASLRLERALFPYLMLALFDFLVRIAGGRDPAGALDRRIEAFAKPIGGALTAAEADGVDEVLIVGHSLGAVVAVRALGLAIEHRRPEPCGARLSLLTLGSVGGYVSAMGGPGAKAYADDLIRIARARDLFWLDVSSPRDWFSFGLVDPLAMLTPPPAGACSPKVISAKFGPARPDPDDRRTRFRAMGLHMRYLSRPELPGGFDFFAAAAGPLTLRDRFAGRRDSPKARMLAS